MHMAKRKLLPLLLTAACVTLFSYPARAEKISPVPKWQRLELSFKSGVSYTNPLHEAEMRVLFVSPLGETNRVYGFWDGGKTWRVRFQPGFPGRWTYYTMCSDTANRGLHEQTGSFLCTATKGEASFDLHGPVQVARSQKHLEHADRTPFLWLGDAAWSAALKSTAADWEELVQTRAKQKFNAVQWRLNPELREPKQAAFTSRDGFSLNLEVLRQLDKKIAAANRAGLLCAIAPLWEISDRSEEQLPEEQAVRLLRHVVARWGADDVAWIIAFESDSTGAPATRWQNIGRAVFNQVTHAPVVLLPGESVWVFDAFRRERWVDVLGVQTTTVANESSLPWLLNGPLTLERQKIPAHPLVTIAPPAEVATKPNSQQVTAELARRLLWWSVLLNTPAGVSYQAQDVADWTTTSTPGKSAAWREALSLPGANAMAPLAGTFAGKDFWRLEPSSQALVASAGLAAEQQIVAASTEAREFSLVYTPEARIVNLALPNAMTSVKANWHNPRTGENLPAKAINPTAIAQRFTTPSAGDWLLVLQKTSGRALVAEAKKPALKIDKRQGD